MTLEIVLVLAVLGGAVARFATERLPVDLVALLWPSLFPRRRRGAQQD